SSEDVDLAQAAPVAAEQAIAEPQAWDGLDPDSQDDIDAQPSSTAEQVLADSMADDDEDDFDFLSGTDECATKLDLARAYVDMGDQEGARDILAEVLDEGNEHQQQDAREMMEQLG
ncbi:MAG: FimV/HubP family polar landmark protein, partial [Halopseudomonas sp.]